MQSRHVVAHKWTKCTPVEDLCKCDPVEAHNGAKGGKDVARRRKHWLVDGCEQSPKDDHARRGQDVCKSAAEGLGSIGKKLSHGLQIANLQKQTLWLSMTCLHSLALLNHEVHVGPMIYDHDMSCMRIVLAIYDASRKLKSLACYSFSLLAAIW